MGKSIKNLAQIFGILRPKCGEKWAKFAQKSWVEGFAPRVEYTVTHQVHNASSQDFCAKFAYFFPNFGGKLGNMAKNSGLMSYAYLTVRNFPSFIPQNFSSYPKCQNSVKIQPFPYLYQPSASIRTG